MADQQLKDPIIKLYFDLIKANTGDFFKAYYYGDPIRIPTSFLPCIIGTKRASSTKTFTNVEDQSDMTLVFTVVTDIRRDISDETQLVPGWSKIFDIMEGRDPNTFLLKPESLMSILRHNVDVGQNKQIWTDVSTPTKIDYGLVMNKRGGTVEASWSIEAALSTVVSMVQLR